MNISGQAFCHSLLCIILMLSSATVIAGEGKELLDRFLDETRSMKADFVQQLRAEDGEVVQESRGEFYLQWPGRFRWEYGEPVDRVIISDGEHVWIHDVELEQVTVQKQGSGVRNTPMALLHGERKLDEIYRIDELDSRGGIHRLRMRSLDTDTDFDEFVVGVSQRGLEFMQLHDQFDQVTDIVFDNIELDSDIDESVFRYTAEEGVDIFGEY